MQAVQKAELTRRSRYYHSQIDMELLLSGISYKELPDTYVIFICNFDPFGEEKYQYTLRQMCEESQGIDVGDGAQTIFFSTCGRNHTEVSKGLVAFLEYVRTPLVECERDFEDDYVSQLQSSVKSIKVNREMGARHMIFQEMLADEREEGRIEGKLSARIEDILEFLESLGTVSQELKVRIQKEKDMETLKRWNKLAAKVESINEFQEKM